MPNMGCVSGFPARCPLHHQMPALCRLCRGLTASTPSPPRCLASSSTPPHVAPLCGLLCLPCRPTKVVSPAAATLPSYNMEPVGLEAAAHIISVPISLVSCMIVLSVHHSCSHNCPMSWCPALQVAQRLSALKQQRSALQKEIKWIVKRDI
jgi:hypothetical protein